LLLSRTLGQFKKLNMMKSSNQPLLMTRNDKNLAKICCSCRFISILYIYIFSSLYCQYFVCKKKIHLKKTFFFYRKSDGYVAPQHIISIFFYKKNCWVSWSLDHDVLSCFFFTNWHIWNSDFLFWT
jgi:hypothetical protein